MAAEFDLVVIGSGPGGYVAAIRASQLGQKVAIVERENLGGICLNWGCIPTKALLKSGEKFESLSHLKEYGLSASGASFDFDAIIQRSRGVAATMNKGIGFLMKKNKIEVIEGSATLECSPAADRSGSGRRQDLGLSRRPGAQEAAQDLRRHRFGRHWHRVRQLLSRPRR